MQLLILLALCCAGAYASDAHDGMDKVHPHRYTLLAESKRREQDLVPTPSNIAATEQQPWRRLGYSGFGSQPGSWPSSPAAGSLATVGPGLMLLGVNLGALLYMILGLLGLAPSYRIGPWHAGDIYRSDRQHLGGDKESTMYF